MNHFKNISFQKYIKIGVRILRRFKYDNRFYWYKGVVTSKGLHTYTVYFYHDKDERTYNYVKDIQEYKELKQKIIILSNNKYSNVIYLFCKLKIPLKTVIQYTLQFSNNEIYKGVVVNYETIYNYLIYIVRDVKDNNIYKICLFHNDNNSEYYIDGVYYVLHLIFVLENIYEEDNIFEKKKVFEEQQNENQHEFEDLESDLLYEEPSRNNQIDS